eukprot:15277-Heterococcus_DN1.PRE.2
MQRGISAVAGAALRTLQLVHISVRGSKSTCLPLCQTAICSHHVSASTAIGILHAMSALSVVAPSCSCSCCCATAACFKASHRLVTYSIGRAAARHSVQCPPISPACHSSCS